MASPRRAKARRSSSSASDAAPGARQRSRHPVGRERRHLKFSPYLRVNSTCSALTFDDAALTNSRLEQTGYGESGERLAMYPDSGKPVVLISASSPAPFSPSPWPAALVVWSAGSLWTAHAHHSFQVCVALTGTLRVRGHQRAAWRSCKALLVPPDVEHEIDARGAGVVIAFLDPENDLAPALLERFGSEITRIGGGVAARWREALRSGPPLDSQRVDLWVRTELLKDRRPRRMHAGIRRVLQYLRDDNLDRRQTSLSTLAGIAGLSPSRFMHVFTETVGIPLRPYLLWLRVQRAACALTSGSTVTAAAYLAGFSDAPHLARTLRRTLGMTPRQLILRVTNTNRVNV
jgi:AraC-like DNA-binding protein